MADERIVPGNKYPIETIEGIRQAEVLSLYGRGRNRSVQYSLLDLDGSLLATPLRTRLRFFRLNVRKASDGS